MCHRLLGQDSRSILLLGRLNVGCLRFVSSLRTSRRRPQLRQYASTKRERTYRQKNGTRDGPLTVYSVEAWTEEDDVPSVLWDPRPTLLSGARNVAFVDLSLEDLLVEQGRDLSVKTSGCENFVDDKLNFVDLHVYRGRMSPCPVSLTQLS